MSRSALARLQRCMLALLLSSCAEDASSLAPFPCALDQSCPSGVLCLPGIGCVPPQADAICAADADCGTGLLCSVGRCEPTCQDGQGCTAQRICSGQKGAGVCLAACAADQPCPGNLVCGALWQPDETACLPAGTAFEAACSTEGGACGPLGANGICALGKCELECDSGMRCPTAQLCTAPTAIGICVIDCTAGQACPSNLVCGALWQPNEDACLPEGTAFESSCSMPDGSACGPFGANGICYRGNCELACDDGTGCPMGRLCTEQTGTGVCFISCTEGQACPSGLNCTSFSEGSKFCEPHGG